MGKESQAREAARNTVKINGTRNLFPLIFIKNKMVWVLWKMTWQFLKKLHIQPSNSTSGTDPKEVKAGLEQLVICTYFHSSVIHKGQKV